MIRLKKHPDIWSQPHLVSLDSRGLCNAGVFANARDDNSGTNIFIEDSQDGHGVWHEGVSFEEGVRVLEVFLGARIERD